MQQIKIFIAQLITSDWIGNLVRWFYNGTLKKYGLQFDIKTPLISSSYVAHLFWGIYESGEIRFIKKYFNDPDLDVIELGGSLGIVSSVIMAQKNAKRKGIVIEANPQLISLIARNIEINKLQNVNILNLALPLFPNTSEIYFEIGETTTTSKIADKPNDRTITIPCKSLSTVIKENSIGNFALISDIEGAEIGLLLHDFASFEKAQLIIIETHKITLDETTYTIEMMKELIINFGYDLLDEHGPIFVFKKK
jgi:FkbM family methyltransferase